MVSSRLEMEAVGEPLDLLVQVGGGRLNRTAQRWKERTVCSRRKSLPERGRMKKSQLKKLNLHRVVVRKTR